MIRLLITTLAACTLALSPSVTSMELQEGTDYLVVEPQVNQDQDIYVYFSYHCGACAALEETFAEVATQLPETVLLKKVPVFNSNNQLDLLYARGQAVAEQHNVAPEYTKALFSRLRAGNAPASLSDLSELAANELNIEPMVFQHAFHAPETTKIIESYLSQSQALQINAVPSVIIGNQYRMLPKRVTSFKEYKDLALNLALMNLKNQA